MKRLIEKDILDHLQKENSLPLLILGARQIGKTYIVKHLAETYFKDKYVYLNFIENNEIHEALKGKTSPQEIINTINFLLKTQIKPGDLIIFDEIQEIPSLKTSLKNFVENKLDYKIICLGSYLGNVLINDNYSFPVGKVRMLDMYPLNFEEYLYATGNEKFIPIIKEALINNQKIDQLNHEFLLNLVYEYMIVGGMPAVVDEFVKNNNMNNVYDLQKNLFNQYRNDILKYIDSKINKTKALLLYDNISTFLAKKNKKYKLSNVESSMKYLNSQKAIKNLLMTKIVYKINNLKNITPPLRTKEKENEFKIYYNDPGFVAFNFRLAKSLLLEKNNNYANEKGAICENYVFSQLKMKSEDLSYYAFRGNENIVNEKEVKRSICNNEYEIDCFVEDINTNAIPIEIKFGTNYTKASINKIMKENKAKYGIVFSSKNFSYDEQTRIYNIPLYAVSFLEFERECLKFK